MMEDCSARRVGEGGEVFGITGKDEQTGLMGKMALKTTISLYASRPVCPKCMPVAGAQYKSEG
jgi:hypothetical protein